MQLCKQRNKHLSQKRDLYLMVIHIVVAAAELCHDFSF